MPAPAVPGVLLEKSPRPAEELVGQAVLATVEVGQADLQERVAAGLGPGEDLLRHLVPFQVELNRLVQVEELQVDPTHEVRGPGDPELVRCGRGIVA